MKLDGNIVGSKWHKAKKVRKRQNTVDNVEVASTFLTKNKFIHPRKLILEGTFSGGSVVGDHVRSVC